MTSAGRDRGGLAAGAPRVAARETRLEPRLVILMGARLGLALVSLGLAFALEAAGGNVAARGLYGTVAFAFLATIAYGLVLRRIRRSKPFAALNIGTDIAIVTALVQCSGGPDSVFTFLYVIVAVYGAILFERKGAIACAVLGALAYGSILLAAHRGWGGLPSGSPSPPSVLLSLWAVHATALAVAAGLGSFLASELRRTDEALHQRTSDLRHLHHLHRRTVESLMSGLLTSDCEGRVSSFNPEAERITGTTAAQALGRDVSEILPGAREIMARCTGDGGGPQSRARCAYRNARGRDLHLGLAAYVLRDEDGRPAGHVVIFQDVSEVVEMERDLRRSERLAAVGRLSASIAHEIRNPLAAISGSIQVLEQRQVADGRDAEARQLMDIVLREAGRLNQLITDFLHYARPGPLRLEALRVEHAAGEVVKMFDAVRPRSVQLELDVPGDLAVRADAAQLRQVLWNLVLNGAEAMPDGGTLRIASGVEAGGVPQGGGTEGRREAEEKAEWAEITVEDEGIGIPPDVLDRIFDPFFTTKRDGSGLGLATVHRIVEGHGGSVRLDSRPGRGTVVRLRLPRAEVSR